MNCRIRLARQADAALLGDVETAAAGRFAGIGLQAIARGRPTAEAEYRSLAADRRLWVTEAEEGRLVGLAIAAAVDGQGYLAELSVHPDYGRRGLGRAMIAAVEDWARARAFTRLYLTTFRDVPWNRPYYERLGFAVVAENQAGPELKAIRQNERARGLDRLSPRVCMVKDLAGA
ncbi:GNAT family N-acetyltransferase [Pelagibius sp.]|uniref:GNAT family N-acetyltransferase n=1 Tax=Pelagibius sp. TaxID=1931238 RepID=UPI00260CDF32|nr:GNAT family N-acetyltransferase [Pelagibius sp.]